MVSSTGVGLSTRVKSFLTGILGAVVLVLNLIGHPLSPEEANSGVDLIVSIVAGFEMAVSAGFHAYGWLRRNFYKQQSLGKFAPSAQQ